MSTDVIGSPPPRPRGAFMASVLTTIAVGLTFAVVALFHFAPPEPQVVEKPPVIKYVQKEAPAKVVYRDVPVYQPAPTLPTIGPVAPEALIPVWQGVWRRKEAPLPMLKLRRDGNCIVGTYAPNWGTVLNFKGGRDDGDVVEFAVDDQIFRLHLRLTMTGEDKGTLESWVTDEDFLESLARANRVVRTPEQARIAKFILEQDQKHLREPKMMGTFLRRDSEY